MKRSRWAAQVAEVAAGFHVPEEIVRGIIEKVSNDPTPIPKYYKYSIAACKYDRAIRLLRQYM